MNTYQKERIRLLLQNVDDLQSAISPMSFAPHAYKNEQREFLLDSVRSHKSIETPKGSSDVPQNQDIMIKECMRKCLKEFDDFISQQIFKRDRLAQIELMRKHIKEVSQLPVDEIIKDQVEIAQDLESHVYTELLAILDEREK